MRSDHTVSIHLGTVTAIGTMPRELTEARQTVLGVLADQVARHLQLATFTAVRAERQLRAEAEQRAAAAAPSAPPGCRLHPSPPEEHDGSKIAIWY